MSTFFQAISVFETRENDLFSFVFYLLLIGLFDKRHLEPLVFYYKDSGNYCKESIDGCRGVGVAYEAPTMHFIWFSIYWSFFLLWMY